MNRGQKLRRRELLTALGASGVILPFFSSLKPLYANPKTPPKRLALFFSANGTIPEAWRPNGTETNFQMNTILKPLEAYKKKMLILEGLSMKVGGPGDGHQQGMGHLFTGTPLLPGDVKGGCKSCAPVSWAGGISVDQHIANFLLNQAKKSGKPAGLRSLDLGVQVRSSNVWARMLYRGSKLPVPPQEDPFQVYKDLFANMGNNNQQQLERLRQQRKSVLDAVKQELTSFKKKLGNNDQKKLDEHLTNVREVERQVGQVSNPVGAACQKPQMGNAIDLKDSKNFPQIGKLQMDLLSMALICNVTQVASLQWSRAVSNTVFTWLGIDKGHHTLSHEGDGNASAKSNLIKINTWYAQQFAYLIKKLDDAKEEGKSVLDNSVVVWGNELGKGNSHTRNDIPFVLAGSAGGYLKTGRYLKYDNHHPHNHLLVSLCHAMGDTGIQHFNMTTHKGPLHNLKA